METLPDWLEQRRRDKSWNVSELARQAGIKPASLSRVLNGTRQAGPDMCLGLARALKVPPEHIFRLAGLLPPRIIGEDHEGQKHELLDYFDALDPDSRNTLVAIAHTLHEQRAEYNAKKDTGE